MSRVKEIIVAIFGLIYVSSASAAASHEECQAALKAFMDLSNVSALMSEAYGYAILPTIGKGGIGIGGAAGSGCVYAQGAQTGTVKMGQVTIGLQLGGEAYSELILFQNKDAFDEFTTGEFEFGAQAQAVALTAGAQASAGTEGASASAGTSAEESSSTEGAFSGGMAIFTIAKGGLMYEASIGGQKFGYEAL